MVVIQLPQRVADFDVKPYCVMNDNVIQIVDSLEKSVCSIDHNITRYNKVGDLIDFVFDKGIETIWIKPYSKLSKMFDYEFIKASSEKYNVDFLDRVDREMDKFATWRNDGEWNNRRTIRVMLPDRSSTWHFRDYDNLVTSQMTMGIAALSRGFQLDINGSPSKLGLEYFESYYSLRHDLITDNIKKIDLPDKCTARTPVWLSKKIPQNKLYLHVVDKTGTFINSTQSTKLGIGKPTNVINPVFDKSIVGVWRVKFHESNSKYNGIEYPLPFSKNIEWVWTPELVIANKLGYEFDVFEANIWEKSKILFKQWAVDVWKIREYFKAEYKRTGQIYYKIAYDAVKNVYTQTIGRLHPTRDDWYKIFVRYDWYDMIVADARLKVLWNVFTYDKEINEMEIFSLDDKPVLIMILHDALYYLSNERDINKALPRMIRNENDLGGWKHKYSFEWSVVKDIFNSINYPGKIGQHLNILEDEKKNLVA
jgi:hypothetical protein